MKKPIVILLIVLAIGCAFVAFSQERPRTIGNPIYCNWLTVQPKFGPRGEIEKFLIDAEFSELQLRPSGDMNVAGVAKIQFDLLRPGGSDDDRKLASLLEERALLEYRTTFPPPLDDRRRAIRSP